MKSFSCTWSLTSVGLRREISQKQFVPQDHRSHHGLRFPADFTPQRDDIGRWFSFFISLRASIAHPDTALGPGSREPNRAINTGNGSTGCLKAPHGISGAGYIRAAIKATGPDWYRCSQHGWQETRTRLPSKRIPSRVETASTREVELSRRSPLKK